MTVNWHILSMDSDPRLRGQLHDYLGRHGFQVSTAFTARELWLKLDKQRVDLLLLGPNAHGETDLDLLKRLRFATDVPLIVSDTAEDESERIIALELGADDYLRRPFNPRELLARIRGFQRRSNGQGRAASGSQAYAFAGWSFTPERNHLQGPDGATLRLTASERRLLLAFVEAPGRILSRDRLQRAIADVKDCIDTQDRCIDMMVWRLRRKLKAPLIRTDRGAGYTFNERVEVTSDVIPDSA
jgi:two-component system, OmpR family, response regulator